jgi:hypothetical protein
MEELVKKFISNPESFTLFRGGNNTNKGGLHFTTDEVWAKNFGDILLVGKLPAGSKIHLLSKEDIDTGVYLMHTKKFDDTAINKFLFEQNNYDAMLGTDSMNSDVLDVIVNPKHLKGFKTE